MTEESDVQRLTIAGLAHRCAQETERFFRRQSYDPRYCFELFRRAIIGREQPAWEAIHAQYQSLVSGWVKQHRAFEVGGEEAQYFVNRAFEKLWIALTPDRFSHFPDLPSLLRYLKMCVYSAIVDHNRTAEQSAWDAEIDSPAVESMAQGSVAEDPTLDQTYRRQFWDWIDERLHDEKERLIIRASFVFGLKPSDICEQFSIMFSDVDEVYRIKQNVLARLRRDPDFQKFLDQND